MTGDIVRCIACSSATHEQEDCTYWDQAAAMRRAGVQVTARELREIAEAARR